MSSARLDVIRERLAAKKTRAFLVVRNDHIVCEWYAAGTPAETTQGTASLAKALAGGMSLAVAITDGKISIGDPAAKFVPQWKDDPRKSQITIRHLGSHTSGLSDSTTEGVKHEEQPGWMGDFWKRLGPPRDPFTLARDETPMLFEPGEKLQYSNPGIGMMTYCVTAAIRGGAPQDIRTLLRDRVMRPLGVPDTEWSVGYGKTYTVDGLPLVATWGGGAYTPRATARLGRLVLRGGDWEGRQILSREAIRQVTGDAGLPGHCGMGWWGNGDRRYSKLPADAVWGAGAGDQVLLVVPSLKLIMVRNGETLAPGPGEPPVKNDDLFTKYHDYRAHILFEALADAVTQRRENANAAPYPPSTVITDLKWAPQETIIRRARGGDNWPMTWADDDALYTAYGDGNGFEPFVPEKLSVGLAKVTGGADDFQGRNLSAPTMERKGDGPAGPKASGLLMVDGTLYLWARNTTNSQLAWSRDHGVTWSWADWRFTQSFGCPSFVNFGRNYAGARDGFVYVLSPDANDAYTPADHLIMARVPLGRIREHAAYEFCAGLEGDGAVRWTPHLAQRGPIFTHPSACHRPKLDFHAALHRYLLVMPIATPASHEADGRVDTRFVGGLAVYDAPEPWGPWSTVFHTERWDVGPGESASFPTKWTSADGYTLHLVFSGNDHFSVRQATLTTVAPAARR